MPPADDTRDKGDFSASAGNQRGNDLPPSRGSEYKGTPHGCAARAMRIVVMATWSKNQILLCSLMLFSRVSLFYMSALSSSSCCFGLDFPVFRRINENPPRLDAASMPNERPALRSIRRESWLGCRPASRACNKGCVISWWRQRRR